MDQTESIIRDYPHLFNDDIDKWLFREFGISGGACSSIESMKYFVAREVAEKAMSYAKKEAINAALCRIQAVAYKYHALDVNGDYCEQPFVDIYSELYELKNEE
jgi:hypothetical protein